MVVAVKQRRSSRRPHSGPDQSGPDEDMTIADQKPVVTPQLWSALETGSEYEERHGEQDSPLTKIGTRFALASLIFDADWYRSEYPDVAAVSMDPVEHYFDNGSREGRNPNRFFDTNWYASNNPDVAAAGLNPFLHYLLYGAKEGRKPAP